MFALSHNASFNASAGLAAGPLPALVQLPVLAPPAVDRLGNDSLVAVQRVRRDDEGVRRLDGRPAEHGRSGAFTPVLTKLVPLSPPVHHEPPVSTRKGDDLIDGCAGKWRTASVPDCVHDIRRAVHDVAFKTLYTILPAVNGCPAKSAMPCFELGQLLEKKMAHLGYGQLFDLGHFCHETGLISLMTSDPTLMIGSLDALQFDQSFQLGSAIPAPYPSLALHRNNLMDARLYKVAKELNRLADLGTTPPVNAISDFHLVSMGLLDAPPAESDKSETAFREHILRRIRTENFQLREYGRRDPLPISQHLARCANRDTRISYLS
ncbi:hypothetical protein [Pandoraea sp. PE-S2R-1]|uniref:hypothetical protein n=1 Tax=Pandoraea sp. PE-S2R-1 TaxID=1986994 RepID=UPI000B3FD32C|nr:hypothetical protein [Pandoraea sp. PE-S2R-1]